MKRYDIEKSGYDHWKFVETPEGDWVKAEDAHKMYEALKAIYEFPDERNIDAETWNLVKDALKAVEG